MRGSLTMIYISVLEIMASVAYPQAQITVDARTSKQFYVINEPIFVDCECQAMSNVYLERDDFDFTLQKIDESTGLALEEIPHSLIKCRFGDNSFLLAAGQNVSQLKIIGEHFHGAREGRFKLTVTMRYKGSPKDECVARSAVCEFTVSKCPEIDLQAFDAIMSFARAKFPRVQNVSQLGGVSGLLGRFPDLCRSLIHDYPTSTFCPYAGIFIARHFLINRGALSSDSDEAEFISRAERLPEHDRARIRQEMRTNNLTTAVSECEVVLGSESDAFLKRYALLLKGELLCTLSKRDEGIGLLNDVIRGQPASWEAHEVKRFLESLDKPPPKPSDKPSDDAEDYSPPLR